MSSEQEASRRQGKKREEFLYIFFILYFHHLFLPYPLLHTTDSDHLDTWLRQEAGLEGGS